MATVPTERALTLCRAVAYALRLHGGVWAEPEVRGAAGVAVGRDRESESRMRIENERKDKVEGLSERQ